MATNEIDSQDPSNQDSDEIDQQSSFNPVIDPSEIKSPDMSMFDFNIELSIEEEKAIVDYLESNLPKMRPSTDENKRIINYLAMYEMAARERSFPYEGAPSLASSDAHDNANKWLDQLDTAFLMQKVTFNIDRNETKLTEEAINRIENTYDKKFFRKILAPEIPLIGFESGYLGCSVICLRDQFNIYPQKEKVVVKDQESYEKNAVKLTKSQQEEAKKSISKGDIYAVERDFIKNEYIGPVPAQVDLTKFWYPRNAKNTKDWRVVSEQEFYTKSSLIKMAEMGELEKDKVENVIESRKRMYQYEFQENGNFPEDVKRFDKLDSNWRSEKAAIQEMGDAYDDEFGVYRVTMLYNLKTKADAEGKLQSWIQVLYCPSGRCLIGKSFCKDGFPYYLVQRRRLPYKAMGNGIAQERYNQNLLDTDMKSLFLASVEQEIGAPLIIRKDSGLFASDFRAYPSSVAYTEDVQRDMAFVPFPEKSRLAVEGMKMILGSSPGANKGAGYASGKREELMMSQEMMETKARIRSIAEGLDCVFNAAWKAHCRLSQYNTDSRKFVDWVYKEPPEDGTKLYILESEMDDNIVWTSVQTSISLSPDARRQNFLIQYEFFHTRQPVSVNNPRLTINWLNKGADYFDMDDNDKAKLLPTPDDFAQLQSQQAMQGGQNQEAPGTALTSQSTTTPFRNPGQSNGKESHPPKGGRL